MTRPIGPDGLPPSPPRSTSPPMALTARAGPSASCGTSAPARSGWTPPCSPHRQLEMDAAPGAGGAGRWSLPAGPAGARPDPTRTRARRAAGRRPPAPLASPSPLMPAAPGGAGGGAIIREPSPPPPAPARRKSVAAPPSPRRCPARHRRDRWPHPRRSPPASPLHAIPPIRPPTGQPHHHPARPPRAGPPNGTWTSSPPSSSEPAGSHMARPQPLTWIRQTPR
jgi:hypothetical protein